MLSPWHNTMLKPMTTEPTFNVELAAVLRNKHPHWPERVTAEQYGVIQGLPNHQIDILVHGTGNSPVAIETEFFPALAVENEAISRIGKVVKSSGQAIEHAIALRVPKRLRSVNQSSLHSEIESAEFSYCVHSASQDGQISRWPRGGWMRGGINDVARCVETVGMSDALITRSTDALENGVAEAANHLLSAPESAQSRIAELLHQSAGEQTNRMAAAIIANAMIFHVRLEGTRDFPNLDELAGASGLLQPDVTQCWQWITDHVNYWPIFDIATRVVRAMPTLHANRVLNCLHRTAAELVEMGAAGLNDISGRMFQRLIADRKFLATYYTLPTSAALLAELAVARLDIEWQNPTSVISVRAADFACGTGTLIGAVYGAMLALHRKFGGDDSQLHLPMMENCLYAFDIMPAATHLAASTLSNAHPSVVFGTTKVVTMPYGFDAQEFPNIGSLELISDEYTRPLFALDQQQPISVAGAGGEPTVGVPHESMDLVIMNPPFARSTGHEAQKVGIPAPAFAGFGTSRIEQKAMSGRLKQVNAGLRKSRKEKTGLQIGEAGHGNAGLGSNFLDLAHEKLVPGGVLALVLPMTFVQGKSWKKSRSLIESLYRDITIVAISNSGSTDRAFSADTGQADVLIVATRKDRPNVSSNSKPLFVNLYRRPQTLLEAVTNARRIISLPRTGQPGELRMTDDPDEIVFGSYWSGSFRAAGGASGVRSVDSIAPAMEALESHHRLHFARRSMSIPVPIARLGDLGIRGAHVLDISGKPPIPGKNPRGPFSHVALLPDEPPSLYPMLWAHKADMETRMLVNPDEQGIVKDGCGDAAVELWEKIASRLHLNYDFRLNSQPLAACLTPTRTIGGRAWPNFKLDHAEWEIPVVLWANSTLGLMSFWWIATRQQSGRVQLPVSMQTHLPVLDPRQLDKSQLVRAKTAYESLTQSEFLPANEAYRDQSRHALDAALLVDVLGMDVELLEEIELLRNIWCFEPSVHGGKSTRPS